MFSGGLFTDCLFPALEFPNQEGGWSYVATDPSRRNVAVWSLGQYGSAVNKRVQTDIKLASGVQRNGGLILDLVYSGVPVRHKYFAVELDHNTDALRVRRYNGFSFTSPLGIVSPLGLRTSKWYRLTAEITDGPSGFVTIAALVEGIDDPGVSAELTVATASYVGAEGQFGVGTDRSAGTRFSYFLLDDL